MMQPAYIGTKRVETAEALRSEIEILAAGRDSYYFLRWPHQVSGICHTLPDADAGWPSPEGQLFNTELELRWQYNRRTTSYDLLLLAQKHNEAVFSGFDSLAGDWECCDRDAILYDPKDKRFPKGFTFSNFPQNKLRQRYFREAMSASVRFVALTLAG